MLAELERIRLESDADHPYFGHSTAQALERQLQEEGERASWSLHLAYGVARLRLGEEELGLEHLLRAHEIVNRADSGASPAERGQVSFYVGVGYLRLAETQNCCNRRVPESCILPIAEPARHSRAEGSTRAIVYFEEVLRNAPADSFGGLAARWLLNLAHMTIGSHPSGVAPEHLIPPRAFEGDGSFPRFRNIAHELGVDRFNLAGGVVADDFDGDGYLDLLTSTWEADGELELFRNDADGRFTPRGREAGFAGLYGGLNLLQADYDNDGDLDLLVLRGAWLGERGAQPNSLLRNDGRARFEDVTFAAGLGDVHHPTQTAGWADYDNDGDLDLYVGNEHTGGTPHPCQLFRNRGDGSFEDVAQAAGVENLRYAKAVSWGDFDEDGWIDLYVSNHAGANRLYRNRGDGTFQDVARELGVEGPRDSFPAWFWDFDNDGHLDLWVSVYNAGIGDVAAHYLGLPARHDLPSLYRGDGRGGFRDVAAAMGLTYPSKPMGSNFGDVDGDGFLDFYLGTGDVSYFSLMPNLLFVNRAGRRFDDMTMAAGLGHLQKGHGIAFADLDNDGDQDIFAQMGGAYPGDRFADALFLNPGFGRRWIAIELEGGPANRSAIGARIRVDVESREGNRSIYRHVTSGGSFGAGPLRQSIGLGDALRIERIEVRWPGGAMQRFNGVGLDRFVSIKQGESAARPFELERLSLGGRP